MTNILTFSHEMIRLSGHVDQSRERSRRARVREERLRVTAGIKSLADMSSWRGRSGRRYVVGVHPVAEPGIAESAADAVVLAVKRSAEGIAEVVDVAGVDGYASANARSHWLARVETLGATEVHIHRLAEGEEARRAIAEDLRD
jgi:hypothetical protein